MTRARTRVVCIGECMVELVPAGPGLLRQGFAGDAGNTAVWLKRCAPALEVQFLTVTGDDSLSEAMRAAWRTEGVGEAMAWRDPVRAPGLYLAETDAVGERRFRYWRGDSAARGWLAALERHGGADRLAGAELVFLTGVSLAILPPGDRRRAVTLLRRLRGRVGALAFDPNLRPALWRSLAEARRSLISVIRAADMVLPSREDLDLMFGPDSLDAHAERLKALGVGEFAITDGAGETLVFDGARYRLSPPKPARVADTAGAGDAFDGAFLAARLAGESAAAAARAGLDLASAKVAHRGALPSRKEISVC